MGRERQGTKIPPWRENQSRFRKYQEMGSSSHLGPELPKKDISEDVGGPRDPALVVAKAV